MPNIFKYGNNGIYFQIPQRHFRSGDIRNWSNSELRLFNYLFFHAHRYGLVTFGKTNAELGEATGMSPASVASARKGLVAKRVIDAEPIAKGQVISGIRYTILSDEGLPMIGKPEEGTGGQFAPRNINSLTRDEHVKYFEHYFPDQNFDSGRNVYVSCPFHDDVNPSFSVNVEGGVWFCHSSRCGQDTGEVKEGGLLAFEMRASKCDKPQAFRNIAKITGISGLVPAREPKEEARVVATYPYADEDGVILFEVCRTVPRGFYTRRLVRGKMRKAAISRYWIPKAKRFAGKDIRRVLYNLPQILRVSSVLVCEGEKDADRLNSLALVDSQGQPVVATTMAFGASAKWQKQFSESLRGKHVAVICDLDAVGPDEAFGGVGVKKGKEIVEALNGVAASIKLVTFSIGHFKDETGDVSDYLNEHSAAELVDLIESEHVRLALAVAA